MHKHTSIPMQAVTETTNAGMVPGQGPGAGGLGPRGGRTPPPYLTFTKLEPLTCSRHLHKTTAKQREASARARTHCLSLSPSRRPSRAASPVIIRRHGQGNCFAYFYSESMDMAGQHTACLCKPRPYTARLMMSQSHRHSQGSSEAWKGSLDTAL